MSIRLCAIILLFACASCNKDKQEGTVETDASLANSLQLSSDTLHISNYSFYLSCDLSRDFMPQSPKDGKPLICNVRLTEKDSLPIPADLKLVRVYVINRNDIWVNVFDNIDFNASYVLEGVSKNGPKWGPDIAVDVVCVFSEGGTEYKIIAKQQQIIATY